MRVGCLSLVVALFLLLVLPWIHADLLETALLKLQIRPHTGALIVAAILIGGVGTFGGILLFGIFALYLS